MTTQEVAVQLFKLCQEGQFMKAVDTLYAKDILSVEPVAMHGMPAEMRGLDAVRGKSVWWMDNHEVHGLKVTGPFVAGDKFIVEFDIDVTNKPSKKRMQMKEAGLYAVANGKVVREDFFMLPQGGK
jgi:chemotaxis signal transduction protein